MKPFRLIVLLGLGLSACAPAVPPATPAPDGTPTPDAASTPAVADRPAVADAADAADAGAAPDVAGDPAAGAAEGPGVEGTDGGERADGAAKRAGTGESPSVRVEVGATEAPSQWWLADTDGAPHGAGVLSAYRELLRGREPAREVVVGIIDSGVDIGHEDLDDNLWVNVDEVAGNGVDDDGNGYVDDVHGWNFIGGADGRHVDQDTYELTRLYAACQDAVGSNGGTGARGAEVGEVYGTPCDEVETAFERRRQETQGMLEQVRYMDTASDRAVELLRGELAGDSLTVAGVKALMPMRLEVRQARQVYLSLAEAGITPEMIDEEEARLTGLLERGLNPAFDPRSIVGDDYEDPDDRAYGNPDVTGPRAGHGTGVAGIVAAERENGIGEDGIAPSARIMVLRAVPNGDERDKDVANAIRYAVDNGAHVINMSFGKGYSPWKDAVDEAVRYAEARGVLLVHAAGNEATDLDREPSYPNRDYRSGGQASTWIEVGASGWQGPDALAAPFSNYGREGVDVFAPGVDIRTTDVDGAFQVNSGTSFAAPVVSGLAALIMAYYPELDAADVKRVILESARPYRTVPVARPGGEGETIRFGDLSATGGVVDARAALELAERLAAEAKRAGT